MTDYLAIAERAARAAGEVLRQWQGRITAREKGPRDLVTEADLAAQQTIQEILLGEFPDHDFIGEEDDQTTARGDSPFCWIVDPLDGTANYVHQLQTYAVSIGLLHNQQLFRGVIYDPVMDECYTAAAGEGAFLNGQRLSVSGCSRLDEALLAASFSARVPRGSAEVQRFIDVLHECRALRRLGSAALNCCYVAAGRLDGYWATSVKSWDVAAGLLIVLEAGGAVSSLDGSPLDIHDPRFLASASPDLHQRLLPLLGGS